MTKVLVNSLSLLAALTAGSASAVEQTRLLNVEKMTCAACPLTVDVAMSRVDGVSNVDVDFDTKTATVTFDDEITTLETVAKASTDVGYPAHTVPNH